MQWGARLLVRATGRSVTGSTYSPMRTARRVFARFPAAEGQCRTDFTGKLETPALYHLG